MTSNEDLEYVEGEGWKCGKCGKNFDVKEMYLIERREEEKGTLNYFLDWIDDSLETLKDMVALLKVVWKQMDKNDMRYVVELTDTIFHIDNEIQYSIGLCKKILKEVDNRREIKNL